MATNRPVFTSPFMDDWGTRTAMNRIEDEFMKVYKRLEKTEDRLKAVEEFVRYVDETAPELRTAYHVSKRME